jgi:hypothetical protein
MWQRPLGGSPLRPWERAVLFALPRSNKKGGRVFKWVGTCTETTSPRKVQPSRDVQMRHSPRFWNRPPLPDRGGGERFPVDKAGGTRGAGTHAGREAPWRSQRRLTGLVQVCRLFRDHHDVRRQAWTLACHVLRAEQTARLETWRVDAGRGGGSVPKQRSREVLTKRKPSLRLSPACPNLSRPGRQPAVRVQSSCACSGHGVDVSSSLDCFAYLKTWPRFRQAGHSRFLSALAMRARSVGWGLR